MNIYGGIEAGGTKFVCMVASGPEDIRAEIRFPTTSPDETIGQSVDFFRQYLPLKAVGVASFGPVDLNPVSPTYGSITTTPKPGWSNTDITGRLRAALGVPVAFDTDVNGAALGEYRWGAAKDCDPVLYITIGTGIGGGCLINGKPMHGLVHPEMGHIRLPRDPKVDPYGGFCPFHGDCFEGLAAGPAMRLRWGQPAETLPEDHPAWELEAHYIALALSDLVCTLSPKRIVLGGGVFDHPGLIQRVRVRTQELLNGYVKSPVILDHIDEYIVRPGLGGRAGVLGAIALAMEM
jgi:fructokinase